MARQPMPIGTGGGVTVVHHPDKKVGDQWQAYCSFRDLDGKRRQVERWGSSDRGARRRLAGALRDRVPKEAKGLSERSRFAEAAELWIAYVERRRSIRTVQSYRWALRCHVLPALGELRLGECRPSRLNAYMDDLAARGFAADTRRNIKTVISGVLGEAVAHDVLVANPARSMRRIEGAPRKVRALTADERTDLLAKVDDLRCAYHVEAAPEKAAACRLCGSRRRNLPDLVRFMLGTGVRIGEALAMRWCDVDLVGVDVVLNGVTLRVFPAAIGPTLVRETGRGLVRQDDGKSVAATRDPLLPEFVVEMLRDRRPPAARDEFPIFPSAAHTTWWDPANAQDSWRYAREQAGYEWVGTHVFRKTAVTILDEAGLSARVIADQVGHSRPSLTQDVYMHRGAASPAAAAALNDAFRAGMIG